VIFFLYSVAAKKAYALCAHPLISWGSCWTN